MFSFVQAHALIFPSTGGCSRAGAEALSPVQPSCPAGRSPPSGHLELLFCRCAGTASDLLQPPGPGCPGPQPRRCWRHWTAADKGFLPLPCLPVSCRYFLWAEPHGKPAGKGVWEM